MEKRSVVPGLLPDQASFIVLDLPSPVAETVKKLRGEYDPKRVLVPAEITIAGSSGLGAVLPFKNHRHSRASLLRPLKNR